MISLLAAASANARNYHIYGDKRDGTKFREIVYSWPIPLKKRYARLSDQEKELVLGTYASLNASDTPPYPKKGIGTILKPYVKKFRWYGTVTSGLLLADIGLDGRASNVRSEVSNEQFLPSEVVRYMSQVLSHLEFDPALCSGTPCEMTFQIDLLPINSPIRNNEVF